VNSLFSIPDVLAQDLVFVENAATATNGGPALRLVGGSIFGAVNGTLCVNAARSGLGEGIGGAGLLLFMNLDPLNPYGAPISFSCIDTEGDLITDGSVSSHSSNAAREHGKPVDSQEVLGGVAALPVYSWSRDKSTPRKHIGPDSAAFHSTFNAGDAAGHIPLDDQNGVALAALKGLIQNVDREQAGNAALDAQIQARGADLANLRERLDRIQTKINTNR